MRLLVFSDLHCDFRRAAQLVAASATVDIVVCAGDLADAHRGLSDMVGALSRIARPTVLVPGNNETYKGLSEACADWKHARVLHGASATIDGVEFFGLGGGIPVTPFGDWSFDFTEEDAVKLLHGMEPGGVLVSHSPPKGVLDRSSSGRSIGSQAVADAVCRLQPRLVVCGHIHASGGEQAILKDTLVVNAGPDGMIVVLDEPKGEWRVDSRLK